MKNIHILPTDKPSRIYLIKSNNKLGITSNNPEFTENFGSGTQNQHIYITSDEEIKEGDWVFLPSNEIYKMSNTDMIHYLESESKSTKKIILTTDQDLIKDGLQAIDNEFLEWFVKNPTYEEVYIIKKYKQVNQDNPLHKGSTALRFSHYEIHLLKATKQMIDEWNLIYCKLKSRQIPIKEEPKQVTAESIVQNTANSLGKSIPETFEIMENFSKELDKLKEKMYSEEEVIHLLKALQLYKLVHTERINIEKWLEKFKKK